MLWSVLVGSASWGGVCPLSAGHAATAWGGRGAAPARAAAAAARPKRLRCRPAAALLLPLIALLIAACPGVAARGAPPGDAARAAAIRARPHGVAAPGEVRLHAAPAAARAAPAAYPAANPAADPAASPAARPSLAAVDDAPPPWLALALARSRAREDAAGEGGGASVASLILSQGAFLDSPCSPPGPCEGPCNGVLAQWDESVPNTQEIEIYVDDELIGTIPPLSIDSSSRRNQAYIVQLSAGLRVLRVASADGTSAEAAIEVLDSQPFGDPVELRCSSSGKGPNEHGACELLAEWTNAVAPPDTYAVSLDGAFVGTLSGIAGRVVLKNVPPGSHTISMVGFKAAPPAAVYMSCLVSSSCVLECASALCAPPRGLTLCQAAYDEGEANVVLAQWINGDDAYDGGLVTVVDGADREAIASDPERGAPTQAFVGSLAPGARTIGLRGLCEAAEAESTVTHASIEILEATPHAQPILGEVACEYNAHDQSATLAWTPGDPSAFAALYIEEASGPRRLLGFTRGDVDSVTLSPARPGISLGIQFFAEGPSGCYGSEVYPCEVIATGARYVPGLCNGAGDSAGNPQITAAIFGLAYLFNGGPAPPCLAACDANRDARFDLSDMIFVLSYLFSGGPSPPVWEDLDGDGVPDATCAVAAPAESCETPHAFCGG